MKRTTEIRVICLQFKKHQGLLATTKKLKERDEVGCSLEPSEEINCMVTF